MIFLKQITGYKGATIADIESDGFLDEATKIHVMSFKMKDREVMSFCGESQEDRIRGLFEYHIQTSTPIVFHNGYTFDVPLAERLLGMDLSGLCLVDTLPMSWYLNVDRRSHSLDSFFDDYGIEKPEVEDWHSLT